MSSRLLEECFIAAIPHLEIASKWRNSKHECIKTASTTAKGNFGQDFTTKFLNEIGVNATVVNGGIGDYDIYLIESGITFEHKLATQDTNDNFQFNAIDKDKNYDYVFCLGVTPDAMYFDIVSKDWLIENLTTKMTKAEGGYKMSKPLRKLTEFTEENLRNKLKGLKKNGK